MNEQKNIVASRIINHAQALGSTAETPKGAHKYIMSHQLRISDKPVVADSYSNWIEAKREYLENESRRRLDRRMSTIPLGGVSRDEIARAERIKNRSRKNWRDPAPSLRVLGESWTNLINCGQYSSRCTYTKWEYLPIVTCFAIERGNLGLEFHWLDTVTFLAPPAGYRWQKDRNGIALISTDGKKDYHPDSDDLRHYTKSAIRTKAVENYRRRQAVMVEQKRQLSEIKKAEREGAVICVADSKRAGNCVAGTLRFAERHGLDPRKHYSPSQLLKIANGDAHRVALAVAVGLRRHRQEMKLGYCDISAHRA